MPTLKLGSTTALTESSGALTINVANPTVTLGSNATFNAPNLGTPSAVTLTNATFPAGHILQVKFNSTNSAVSTTSTSYVSTGMSLSITPSSSSSKIYILGSHVLRAPSSSNYQHNVKRNSTFIAPTESRGFTQFRHAAPSSSNVSASTQAFVYLDSPNTTSQVTYTVWHKSEGGNIAYYAIDNSYASLTLMEVAQ